MKGKKQNWTDLVRWCAAVLLLVAALQQVALLFMWNGVSQETLLQSLETEYLKNQSEMLSAQLNELATAAGVEPVDAKALKDRLVQGVKTQFNGDAAPQPQAGTEMKSQLQQQLEEKGLEPNEEISKQMDLLESEGNRLEQTVLQQPVWEQMKQYVQQVEQKKAIFPAILWSLGFVVLAVAGFCLPKFNLSFLLSGLAMGGILSSLMMILMKAQVKIPVLKMSGSKEEMMLNNALEKYFAPLQFSAAILDIVLAVITAVFIVLLVLDIRKKKSL